MLLLAYRISPYSFRTKNSVYNVKIEFFHNYLNFLQFLNSKKEEFPQKLSKEILYSEMKYFWAIETREQQSLIIGLKVCSLSCLTKKELLIWFLISYISTKLHCYVWCYTRVVQFNTFLCLSWDSPTYHLPTRSNTYQQIKQYILNSIHINGLSYHDKYLDFANKIIWHTIEFALDWIFLDHK